MKKLAAVLCAISVIFCAAAQEYELSYYQEFDSEGRVTYEKDAYGYEAKAMYDKKGNQIYFKSTVDGELDAEGWFTYHANGEIKNCRVIDGSEEWFYIYDKNGNITYVETPSGDVYTYYYDSLGRNTYASSKDGGKVFFAYTDDIVYANYITNDDILFYEYDNVGNIISSYSVKEGALTTYDNDSLAASEDSDYDYSGDDGYYYDNDYDDQYWNDYYGYDADDDITEEYDRYGNVTLRTTRYYSEKYEYTYYRDGTIKTVTCYDRVFDNF